MSWLPGWGSIGATAWWSTVYFWASIASLMLLGAMEVISHRYSDRKDELVELQQIAEKKVHDEEMSRVRRDAALAIERAARLEKEAAEARLKIAELQQIAPRILSVPAQNSLREALKGIGPLVVHVGTSMPLVHAFDIDSLASQIAGAIALAGWRAQAGVTWGREDRPTGIWIASKEDKEAATASDIIVAELNKAGIVAQRDPQSLGGAKPPVPAGAPPMADIHVLVGTKP